MTTDRPTPQLIRILGSLGLVALLAVALACSPEADGSNDGNDVNDTNSTDNGDDNDNDNNDVIDCDPGEIVSCPGVDDATTEVCNGTGDGVETSSCPGTAICRDASCVDVNCMPGAQRCTEAGVPERCEDDGAGDFEWVEQDACDGDETCENGTCLDRCGIAEQQDSYVGCEYWALETDNRLLHTDDDGTPSVDPEHRPPFAVVLANTETDVTAEVTVDGPDGEIAESIAEREVRSHRQNPGDEFETVHSETVDQYGQRIGGPHDGPIEDIELPPGATLTLLLPNQDVPFGETTVSSTAYRVETTEPVVAYQFNPFCCNYNYTNDASMLMPARALTENYMMSGPAVWARQETASAIDPFSPTLSVVAMESNTTVEVQLRNPIFSNISTNPVALDEQCPGLPNAMQSQYSLYADDDENSCFLYPTRDGDGISGPDANGVLEVTLDEHEVFNVAAAGAYPSVDLSGARVEADKPVAAFGAHTCTNVPFTQSACDHVESQLYPLETWGLSFIAAPHKLRNPDAGDSSSEGTYWKIVARDDGTTINSSASIHPADTLPPSSEGVPRCGDSQFSDDPESGVFEMDSGEYCEFGTREILEITSNRPISIAGLMSGQNTVFNQVDWGDRAGDPSMFMVPPEEQFRSDYTFLVPPTYHDNFITVIVQANMNLIHNGETIVPSDHDYHELEDSSMSMAHIEVEPGPHTIESPAAMPFGLIVYGFDNYVSYSYTGGLDLAKDNPLQDQ